MLPEMMKQSFKMNENNQNSQNISTKSSIVPLTPKESEKHKFDFKFDHDKVTLNFLIVYCFDWKCCNNLTNLYKQIKKRKISLINDSIKIQLDYNMTPSAGKHIYLNI